MNRIEVIKRLIPLRRREVEVRPLTFTEQIRRAHPTVGGPTYDYMTGKITREERDRLIGEDRARLIGTTPLTVSSEIVS